MSKYSVLEGERYNRLTITKSFIGSFGGHKRCEVVCDCSTVKSVSIRDVVLGRVVSCGCKRLEGMYVHGMYKSRPFSIHGHMKRRCDTPNEAGYPHYGGRGISYDSKWATFEGFWEDMSEGYSDELELDRIDPNGDYCKENCRWADQTLQCFNTRKRIDNTSGKSGVSWDKKSENWHVYININSKRYNLGRYKDLELAIFIREEAELKYYGFIKE